MTSGRGVWMSTPKGKTKAARKAVSDFSNRQSQVRSAQTILRSEPVRPAQDQLDWVLIKVSCSCGGENERCFKCDGTGIEEKKVARAEAGRYQEGLGRTHEAALSARPAGFASDFRGGAYGIREYGRFGSGPDFDDFD